MSDSFADLWSASAPPKPKAQPLSSAISSSSNQNKPYTSAKPDVFALLANSGSGTSTPRYGTALGGSGSTPGSRSITPSVSNLSSSTRTTPQPQTMAKPGGGGATDAFGDLFSSSSSKSSANMTLAARLAMDSQRGGSSQREHGSGTTTTSVGSSAWAGLDALAGSLAPTPVAAAKGVHQTMIKIDDVDDWGLSDFGSNIHAARSSSTTGGNTNVTGSARPKPKTTASLWDLDDFSSATDIDGSQSYITTVRHGDRAIREEDVTSPDEEFDFGHREDRVDEERWEHRTKGVSGHSLLDAFEDDHDVLRGGETTHGLLDSDGHHHDEDDVLGLLSEPVEVVRKRHTPSPEPAGRRPSPPASAPKPPSPPPHILGQIVEMGFSVQQARIALARTSTGLDVPAAIESLINSNRSSPAPSLPNSTQHSRDPPRAEVPPPRSRGAPKGQKERERERLERQRAAATGEGPSQTPTVADIQEQADKLLAQASEIGLSVFSKASAMWGKGKERVVKAYEERAGSASPFGDGSGSRASGLGRGRVGPGRIVDGRPKWMQEAVEEEYGEDKHHQDGFKDDHVVFEASDDEGPSLLTKQARQAQVVEAAHREEEVDLFSNTPVAPRTQLQAATAPPPSRTAPQRHRRPPLTRESSTATSSSRSVAAPPRAITPPPERKLPTATPAALATTLKHKTTGTEQFKLGQYAAAVDAYSLAIQALPRGHLLLVPLYTNRALARIRCGEYKASEDDCAQALGIIFDDGTAGAEDDFGATTTVVREGKSLVWSPSALPPSLQQSATQTPQAAWAHPQGRGVDLADGYVKALRRRAEALEGRERWAAAAADWEVLAGCAWASESVRKDAVRGRGRCKGMDSAIANGDGSTTTITSSRPRSNPSAPKPKPRRTANPSAPEPPSEALRALQSQNAQAEAEDSLKYSLKDGVDARLAAWRQGREGNIRALLVGLDGVLWEGILEGVRVRGLHELVSAAQVKKGYVRVIGRVHPDKLNARNSTVEQRMLANGVFGTLNDAWIAFQATQK